MTVGRKFGDWVLSYRNGYGKRPGAGESGPIVLRIADVSSGSIDLSNPRRGSVSAKDAETYRLQPGDLIFVRVNGAREIVGRCCVVGPEVPPNTIFNDHLIRVRLVPGVDPDFAKICVSVPPARAIIEEAASTSAGQLTISQQVLDSIDVSDIPFDKQREIAARLKAQLTEVEIARQAMQLQAQDIALLRSRVVAGVFETVAVDAVSLGDVVLDIQAGKSFQTAEVLARPDELGVLKVSAVSWSNFRPEEAKALKSDYRPEAHHRVSKGDVVISRANTKELVGAVVLVDRDYPSRLLSDKTLRLVIDEERASKEYLVHALRAPMARKHIEHFATGTSDSMRNISQGVINSIPVRLPSVLEQHRIAASLKVQLAEVDLLEASNKAMLADLDRLPQCLLAQAFGNSA